MKMKKNFIPSIFTVLNMFAGFLSILQVISGHYITAVMLIVLAAFFDMLDGKVARWLQQESDFGVQIDSLADMLSFCVAPSVLLNVLFASDLGIIGAVISFFPALFGAVRLARYNLSVTGLKRRYFSGMPTPSNAIIIGSYVWFHYTMFGVYGEAKVMLPLVIFLSFLMVSRIKFISTVNVQFRGNLGQKLRFVGFLVMLLAMLVFPGYTIFPISMIYVITHILMWLAGGEETRMALLIRRKV